MISRKLLRLALCARTLSRPEPTHNAPTPVGRHRRGRVQHSLHIIKTSSEDPGQLHVAGMGRYVCASLYEKPLALKKMGNCFRLFPVAPTPSTIRYLCCVYPTISSRKSEQVYIYNQYTRSRIKCRFIEAHTMALSGDLIMLKLIMNWGRYRTCSHWLDAGWKLNSFLGKRDKKSDAYALLWM